jgi:hypothetical protein
MRWRRDEWSERLSALVLLGVSVVVLLWSRARVQDTEALLDRREEQLQQVLAWTRTNDAVPDERVVAAVTALFGRERARAVAGPGEATR